MNIQVDDEVLAITSGRSSRRIIASKVSNESIKALMHNASDGNEHKHEGEEEEVQDDESVLSKDESYS